MTQEPMDLKEWAEDEFGHAELGDRRRVKRLVGMAARARGCPDGRLTEVFEEAAELQGAYDFVENDKVLVESLTAAAATATARRCAQQPFVYVAIDGSSLTIVDREKTKGFGCIGSGAMMTRGLKVMSALAIDAQGVPQGLLSQRWWARKQKPRRKPQERAKLPPEQKETRHWLAAMVQARRACERQQTKPWFVIDREGDSRAIILECVDRGTPFTVRASWDRVVEGGYLRSTLMRQRLAGVQMLPVQAGPRRRGRLARMHLRSMRLSVRFRDRRTEKSRWVELSAVWARETGTTPPGEKRLDWLLYTDQPATTVDQIRQILHTYTLRWRIEDFHRTWKSGCCNVESTQLHTTDAVIRWATILASVATRIERLKYLARHQPDAPASDELTPDEIQILVAWATRIRKRTEKPPRTNLTIHDAVDWIARFGGYTGKSSGGPPGSITIGRGLERLSIGAELLEVMRSMPQFQK